jgi:hypothetical protein
LSKESAESLVSIISTTNENLSKILSKFSSTLDIKTRVICLKNLSLLLSDGFLDHNQQVVALWIVYKSFEVEDIEEHPFRPLFIHIYDFRISKPNVYSPMVYNMIACILSKQDISTLGNFSVKSLINSEFPVVIPKSIDSSSNKVQYTRLSPVLIESIKASANDSNGKEQNAQPKKEQTISHNEAMVSLLLNPSYSNDFEPPFLRPVPDITPICEHELEQSFVVSQFNPPFIYDENSNRKNANLG